MTISKIKCYEKIYIFWVTDDQIKNWQGNQVSWWDSTIKKSGNVDFTEDQYIKVQSALTWHRWRLEARGWYRTNLTSTGEISEDSWEYYKSKKEWWYKMTKATDGDTMTFKTLKGTKLLLKTEEEKENDEKPKVTNDNVRILVLDTDETLWMRYQKKAKRQRFTNKTGLCSKSCC